jgi:MPBQ/MSBQ methyltransferase
VAPRQRCAAESEAAALAEAAAASTHRVASFQLAEAAPAAAPALPVNPATLAIAGAVALGAYGIKRIYDTPSRTYDNNVGDEYDSWTQEGILEYYWGEHIHLGHYTEQERAAGYLKKNFKQAKFDFVDEMFNFSESATPTRILDVGCGIGGTSRHLAKKFPGASVKGQLQPPLLLLPPPGSRAAEAAGRRQLAEAAPPAQCWPAAAPAAAPAAPLLWWPPVRPPTPPGA